MEPEQTVRAQQQASKGSRQRHNRPLTLLLWGLLLSSLAFAQHKEPVVPQHAAARAEAEAQISRLLEQALMLRNRGRLDSAAALGTQAVGLAVQHRLPRQEARAEVALGNLYIRSADQADALRHLLQGARLYTQLQDSVQLGLVFSRIGHVYDQQFDTANANTFFKLAGRISERMADPELQITHLLNQTLVYQRREKYQQALRQAQAAEELLRQHPDQELEVAVASYQAQLNSEAGNFARSSQALQRWLQLVRQSGDQHSEAVALAAQGSMNIDRGEPQQAITVLRQALRQAYRTGNRELARNIHFNLAYAYQQAGAFEQAYDAAWSYIDSKDSLMSERSQRQVHALQEQFQSELRTAEIRLLRQDQQLKAARISRRTWERNLVLAGLLVTLLMAGLIIRTVRQRQRATALLAAKNEELSRQRLQEMRQEQELRALQAMIEGQETERHRIAEELHDRIGSLLATVKLNFHATERLAKAGKDNALQYRQSYALLDEACYDVRRLSHQMAANVLSKFGLVPALDDLSRAINSSEQVQMHLQVEGLESRLDQQTEVAVYRIIQELTGNSLKHAQASEIRVQLLRQDHTLHLEISDNGVGMALEQVEKATGMGMGNVQARVNQLRGTLELASAPGKGTTIRVAVPV